MLKHVCSLSALILTSSPVLADTVRLGNIYSGGFDMIVDGAVMSGAGGGNIGGSYGVIDGVQYNFGRGSDSGLVVVRKWTEVLARRRVRRRAAVRTWPSRYWRGRTRSVISRSAKE